MHQDNNHELPDWQRGQYAPVGSEPLKAPTRPVNQWTVRGDAYKHRLVEARINLRRNDA